MNEKIDLFETLVKFLAVKPLNLNEFDFKEAQSVIKKDKLESITFLGEHGYFEHILDAFTHQVAESQTKGGTVYIYIRGAGCTERLKRRLVEMLMHVNSVIIFGDQTHWPISHPRIKFTKNFDIFADNHQRFFIFHGPGYNVALVSRHHEHEGVEETEAAITNDPEAVSLLALTVGTKIYPLEDEVELTAEN